MKNKKHLNNSFHHCWERVFQRYKKHISEQQYNKFNKIIKDNRKDWTKISFYLFTSRGKEIYLLSPNKRENFLVVFNPKLNVLSTFLPLDNIKRDKFYKRLSNSMVVYLHNKKLLNKKYI